MLFSWGIVDVIAGSLLALNFVSFFHTLLFYFGVIILVKGMWTLVMRWRNKIYFDVTNWVDVLSGAIMLLIYFGVSTPFSWILGLAIIIKGLWSMITAM
ncbi:MAG: DUF308 domain-containing protein [Candidatus Aenigmarchaeota archaeon]|nr:DUF308 domain-containing protein [Candidatus Aenigmarchaeota archaeon]